MAASAPTVNIPCVTFTWKTDSSAGNIPAHVYHHSSAREQGPHPIALMFHAGGFVMGSAAMIPRNQIINLLTRGFVVVTPEYRLCPQVSLYDGPVQDAKDVLSWCQDKLPALLKEATGIEADGDRVVSMGHSAGAFLALTTGACAKPPRAIVDFYGPKYLRDFTFFRPLAAFAQIPDLPEEHTSKILEGPLALQSQPMMINGKPNLEDPRSAWFITQLKKGTSISALVPDGDYERLEATAGFSKNFPPTFFLQGTADAFVDPVLSQRAHKQLKALGVETELLMGEFPHIFDIQIQYTDPLFKQYVVPAMDFLKNHV